MRLLPALVVFMLLGAGRAQAAEWQVASHEPGLTLYTRAAPGQDLKDFRGVVRIKAPMRAVVQTLADAGHMPEWFFNMREARFLDIGSGSGSEDSHLYFVIKGMWPVSDRDGVLRLQLEQEARTLVLHMTGSAAPEAYPPMRERVRIPRLQVDWTVTPVSATETEVCLEGQADPGGAIPVWMANLVVVQLPETTLRNLRRRLEAEGVRNTAPLTDPRLAKLLSTVKFPEPVP